MATERTRQLVLVALALVLAFVLYRMWPGTSAAPGAASNQHAASGTAAPAQRATGRASTGSTGQSGVSAPDVHLESLGAEWPKPGPTERNLFRFKPKAAPPPAPTPVRQALPPGAAPPPPPPGPPPLPPITLKVIGIME